MRGLTLRRCGRLKHVPLLKLLLFEDVCSAQYGPSRHPCLFHCRHDLFKGMALDPVTQHLCRGARYLVDLERHSHNHADMLPSERRRVML